uniref:Uncharacterized protein n=1 Tax=Xiphophorus couchianus TaxID=32473 RepID=A0A3B5M0D0_9TELE
MPFAWSVRPVFKDSHGGLDRESRFSPLFKQESNKISTDDLIKLQPAYLQDKTHIPVCIPVFLHSPLLSNCVTSSYVPVRPFEELSKHQPTVEMEEFVQDTTKFTQPHRVYRNHIYVYPKHLKYDSQKSFAKVVLVHIVSKCHEENLDHYLQSYIKVKCKR